MRHIYHIFILIALYPIYSFAQFPWSHYQETKEEEKNTTSSYSFAIDTQMMRFLTEAKNRYFAGATLKVKHPYLDIDVAYVYSRSENYHYFQPYELAFNINTLHGQWSIGRKKIEWNWADQFWNRGLWQPLYKTDTLRTTLAGLTGIFRQFQYGKDLKVLFFTSLLFIPEAKPHIRNMDGKLQSDNPWFTPPASTNTQFSPSTVRYSYFIQPIDWNNWFPLSLASHVRYKNFFISYGYKPMNTLKVKTILNLDLNQEFDDDGFHTPLNIDTVIVKHHLISIGWNLTYSNQSASDKQQNIFRLYTSMTYNHPEKQQDIQENTLFFQPKRELHYSVKGEFSVRDQSEETTLHIAYTQRFTRASDETTLLLSSLFPNLSEQQFFRDDLFQFSRTASTGLQHIIKLTEEYTTELNARLFYHLTKKYFLLSFLSAFNINIVSVFVSGDILFTTFPFSSIQATNDIGIYKNKSRVFGGIKLVF